MANNSPSSPKQRNGNMLDDRLMNIIREMEASLHPTYLAALEKFRGAVHGLISPFDVPIDAETVRKNQEMLEAFPAIHRFGSVDAFWDFYKELIINKVRARRKEGEEEVPFVPKESLAVLVDLYDRAAAAGISDKYLLPWKETSKNEEDQSKNINCGGLHALIECVLPDGRSIASRVKFFGEQKDYDTESRTLTVFSKMGKKVTKPESIKSDPPVLATRLYSKGDLWYLIDLDEHGRLVHGKAERKKKAEDALETLADAMIHFNAYAANLETAPADIRAQIKEILDDKELFKTNNSRGGIFRGSLAKGFFSRASKGAGIKHECTKESDEVVELYHQMIIKPLLDYQQFICHGDFTPGNILEDFDGSLAITDFTLKNAPVSYDANSIIEHLALLPKDRKELIGKAAEIVFRNAKERKLPLYTKKDKDGKCAEVASVEQYREQFAEEYTLMKMHKSLMTAGYLLVGKPRGGQDPSVYYSTALKICDELGQKDARYNELGAKLRKYSEKFRMVMSEVEVPDCFQPKMLSSLSYSTLEEKLIRNFDPDGVSEKEQHPKKDEIPEDGQTYRGEDAFSQEQKPVSGQDAPEKVVELYQIGSTLLKPGQTYRIRMPEDRAATVKPLPSLDELRRAKGGVPPGPMCDFTAKVAAHNIIIAMANGKKIVDVGHRYHIEGIKEQLFDDIGMPPPQTVEKVQGDWEFSLRGDELHAINHSHSTHIMTNVRLAAEDYKKAGMSQIPQSEFVEIHPKRGVFTDPRSVLQILREREDQYGKGKVAIESLEDCALFKAGGKVVDELLWDTAPLELQALKYYNQGLKRGYGLLFQFPVNGVTAPPAVEPISPLEHVALEGGKYTPTIFNGLQILKKKGFVHLFNVHNVPQIKPAYVRVDHSNSHPETRVIVPTTVLVQNGKAYVTRNTGAVDVHELEKLDPNAVATMNRKRNNSVFQKIARHLSPTAYEWVMDHAKSAGQCTEKLDEYPIAISTSEGTRCYTVIDGQSKIVSPVTLRKAEFHAINPQSRMPDSVTDIIAYAATPFALLGAVQAGMAANCGSIEDVVQKLGCVAFPLGVIAAGRLTKKYMTQYYKKIAKEPPHYE